MTNRRCHVKNVHTYYVPHVKFINSSHIVIWSQDFDICIFMVVSAFEYCIGKIIVLKNHSQPVLN